MHLCQKQKRSSTPKSANNTTIGSVAISAGPPQKPARVIRASFSGSAEGGFEAYAFGAEVEADEVLQKKEAVAVVTGRFSDFLNEATSSSDDFDQGADAAFAVRADASAGASPRRRPSYTAPPTPTAMASDVASADSAVTPME